MQPHALTGWWTDHLYCTQDELDEINDSPRNLAELVCLSVVTPGIWDRVQLMPMVRSGWTRLGLIVACFDAADQLSSFDR